MREDEIEIIILEDGTLKVTTSPISSQNHFNAATFIKEMGRLAGGLVTRKRRPNSKHNHSHGHEHEHEHEKH